jgi:hypothetical protein
MLAKVTLPNDYFPVGCFVDITDGDAQRVVTYTVDGRLGVKGYEGLVIPADKVRPYVFMLLKRGFDDQGAHKEIRRAVAH